MVIKIYNPFFCKIRGGDPNKIVTIISKKNTPTFKQTAIIANPHEGCGNAPVIILAGLPIRYGNPKIARLVPAGAVASKVKTGIGRKIRVDTTLVIAVNGSNLARPRGFKREVA